MLKNLEVRTVVVLIFIVLAYVFYTIYRRFGQLVIS